LRSVQYTVEFNKKVVSIAYRAAVPSAEIDRRDHTFVLFVPWPMLAWL